MWCLSLLLTGCLPTGSSVPAPSNALACAEQTALGLGYLLVSRTGEAGAGSFTAERPAPGENGQPGVGVIEASARRTPDGGTRLSVTGNRYRERIDLPTGTRPLPGIGDGVIPTGAPGPAQGGARRRGRYRIHPGPIAEDARFIRQQCGGAAAPSVPATRLSRSH
jgi:hypothetical protein